MTEGIAFILTGIAPLLPCREPSIAAHDHMLSPPKKRKTDSTKLTNLFIISFFILLQILNMIPKEPDGERFEEALARVLRCVGGGGAAENADSDSDLEVIADSFTINLRCPVSIILRVKKPVLLVGLVVFT